MARSLRSLSDSGLTAALTPRSILAPSMKARACHHPSRQRQPSLTCDPVRTTPTSVLVWRDELTALQERLGKLFGRPEPRRQAGLYLEGLLSATERKNG